MPTLLPGVFEAKQGACFTTPDGAVLSRWVRGMPHGSASAGLEVLTHLHQHLVRRSSQQRDELGAIFQIDRAYAVMSLGIRGAIPVEVSATRAPTVATVLANGDLGVAGVIGAGDRTELAANR